MFNYRFAEMEVTGRTISLLTCVVKGTKYLKFLEVTRAVQYCFPQIDDKNLLRSIIDFVNDLGNRLVKNGDTKKHPLILILDDVSIYCLVTAIFNVVTKIPIL